MPGLVMMAGSMDPRAYTVVREGEGWIAYSAETP